MSNQDGAGSSDPMQTNDPQTTSHQDDTVSSPRTLAEILGIRINSDDADSNPASAPSPKHYDLVPDGDAIFELDDNVSVRVSSVVLSLASKYFSKRFSGEWKDCSVERSATNPATPDLKKMNPHAIYRLFCLLHHQPDPEQNLHLSVVARADLEAAIPTAARKLRDLAIVSDYFPCIDPLKMVFQSLLSDFATIRVKKWTSFQSTADLVTAAYLMDQPHHFRLFTKRLVTEFDDGLADAKFPPQVLASSNLVAELQRQSDSAWATLNERLPRLANGKCKAGAVLACSEAVSDPLFLQRMFQSSFPPGVDLPQNRDVGLCLSELLSALYHVDRMQRVIWCEKHRCHTHDTIGKNSVADICLRVDDMTRGLCLTCTKSTRYGGRCTCLRTENAKTDSAQDWVLGDSIDYQWSGCWR